MGAKIVVVSSNRLQIYGFWGYSSEKGMGIRIGEHDVGDDRMFFGTGRRAG